MSNANAQILVQAKEITKSFGAKKLYASSSFSILEGEKLCLYGPNGSGKSSLFRILSGEYEIDSGEISWRSGTNYSYLKQNLETDFTSSLNDYVTQREPELNPWEIKKIAKGLGLLEEHFSKKITELSGGYRMRFFLSIELAREPDLLLLDEPTNHLDLESVLFLENYLEEYKKSFILISHDRELIFKVCDQSLVIDDNELIKFPDKLEKYFEFAESMEEQKQRENAKVLQKKKHLEDFIKRFGAKATKAKQAKSKQKQIDRLADIHSKKISYFPKVPIPEATTTGKNILESKSSGLSYPGKEVLQEFELQIFRSQKIAILGENGVGKTTLLKYLAGVLKDNSGDSPRYYKNCEPAYFAQHLEDELEPDKTLFEQVSKKCSVDISDQEIADTLGHLGFSDLDWQKKIAVLSGGEKMRVVLAWVLLKKSAFLLLDEPTNHLDFQTVEALAEALKETNSCVVFVSHDRSFVNKVAKNIFEITEKKLQIYPGNYQDYVAQKRLQKPSKTETSTSSVNKTKASNEKFNYKEEKKKLEKDKRALQQKTESLEQEMEKLEQEILELNELLSKDSQLANKENIELLNKKGSLKQEKENQYFQALENLEKIEKLICDLIN
tara:strand:+ start:2584 stop:4419 length:1836 start_codon:yes stop_codon:yes gene_type:complete